MPILKAFYGSSVPIQKWDPSRTREFGYHFALERPDASLHRLQHLGGGWLYEVRLTVQNPLAGWDVIGWNLETVLDVMRVKDPIRRKELKIEASSAARKKGTSLTAEGNAIAARELTAAGWDAITYDNKGEAGGPAIVIWDPRAIETVRGAPVDEWDTLREFVRRCLEGLQG